MIRRCAWWAFLALTLTGLLGVTEIARAQVEGDEQKARELFERGIELAERERWAEALEFFERSRAQSKRPVTVFNIASTLFRLGRAQEALQAIEEFLALADPERDAVEREEALRLRDEVKASFVTLLLTVSPPTAQVSVDGAERPGEGATRELTLDPGTHVLTVSARGHRTHRAEVSLLPGEKTSLEVTLTTEQVMLVVVTGTDDALIQVDGETVGTGRAEVSLDPGSYRVEVPDQDFNRSVTLEPGQRLELDARGSSTIFESPVFWALVGGVVLAGGVLGALIATDSFYSEESPYGGSANFTLEALVAP